MIVVKARLTRHPDVVRQWFLGKLFRRLGGVMMSEVFEQRAAAFLQCLEVAELIVGGSVRAHPQQLIFVSLDEFASS